MSTDTQDFRVKHGLQVTNAATFSNTVTVAGNTTISGKSLIVTGGDNLAINAEGRSVFSNTLNVANGGLTAYNYSATGAVTGFSANAANSTSQTRILLTTAGIAITGDLTVSGNTTTSGTTRSTTGDIILWDGYQGAPISDATIKVERGTSADVYIRWNETNDLWEFTNDGSIYYPFRTYSSLVFSFSTSTTTNADPGNGKVRFNSATYSSITEIAVDLLEYGGSNISDYILTLDDSTSSSTKSYIIFRSSVNQNVFHLFKVTGSIITATAGVNRIPVTYVSGSASTFNNNDVLFFETAGIVGDTGAQGPTGPTGPQGPTGFQGPTGSQGPTGVQGPTGAQGPQGRQGSQGSQGFQGIQGSQGSQGSIGTTGATGAQGPTGPQGSQGTQGTTGADGVQGPQGVTGGAGAQGSQGPQGPQGPQGRQGFQGFQGITGGTGSQGSQGYQGIQGSAGTNGNDGAQGPNGPQGSQGSTGTFSSGSNYNAASLYIGSTYTPTYTEGRITAEDDIIAYYSSDRNFKDNIRDIPDALEKVKFIGGKLFDWNDFYLNKHGGEHEYFLPKESFGVIAQDVEAVFPIAVRHRPDGSLAVDYDKLIALAFAAIKELSEKSN